MICIIYPRQKVKRFIFEIAYFVFRITGSSSSLKKTGAPEGIFWRALTIYSSIELNAL